MIRLDQIVTVHDPSQVAAARRIAAQCSEKLELGVTSAGKAALVVTELATNLLKHGEGGAILFGSEREPSKALILVAFDRGRGIENVAQAMEDGFSTAGSSGTGLGAVSRNASACELFTQDDRGTAILCRIEEEAATPSVVQDPFAIGGVCVPKPGEDQAGDAWVAIHGSGFTTVAIADGLGHGNFASTASSAALRVIAEHPERPLEHIYAEMHAALRRTRGAAVGVARIHRDQNRLEFVGIGNISGGIVGGAATRRVVSLNGIVGHEMRRVQMFSYPWPDGATLILASDGVSMNWNVSSYPGLLQRDPALAAAVLFRDHTRGNDDATIVVVKSP